MTVSDRASITPDAPVEISPEDYRLPSHSEAIEQDEEWLEVRGDDGWRRLRFHDYDEIYKIPGLYEELFYNRLKCESPTRVVELLGDVLSDMSIPPRKLRAFDIGAGNGMVGEELRALGVPVVVGNDIIPEAAMATDRDRPNVYEDYIVADLTALTPEQQRKLESYNFNCLASVAALGFGDIPALAFANAYNLVENKGWLAFNVKERFLRHEDDTGFAKLIRALMDGGQLETHAYRRYVHRLSSAGEKLYYVAMVGRKLGDVPEGLVDSLE